MRVWAILTVIICCVGCSAKLVYTPAPAGQLDALKTIQTAGTITPWNLYFQTVSYASDNSVRLIVLNEIGLKILDMTVRETTPRLHYKAAGVPVVAVKAFAGFAWNRLRTPCPVQELTYRDKATRTVFTAHLQGDTICP